MSGRGRSGGHLVYNVFGNPNQVSTQSILDAQLLLIDCMDMYYAWSLRRYSTAAVVLLLLEPKQASAQYTN